jgi:exodeoxyribonuclease-3
MANLRLISWNVNGVRAVVKKDFDKILKKLDADVICLQETKAQDDQVQEALAEIKGYHVYSFSAEKKGYSGTAILSKVKPINVTIGIGKKEHDNEGRVLCAEYDDCFVVTVYVPNAQNELKRIDYREKWDKDFAAYLKKLDAQKPVLVCGDFNVCHQAIDLARPKPNYNKSAGYTQREIDGMSRFLKNGMVDTFRALHPDTVAYSWWSYRGGAREKNVGWRLDYWLVSERYFDKVTVADILPDVMGSDHCPVGITVG